MEPLWERVEELHAAGLESSSIVREYLEQRLAPLQGHSNPIWLCAGLAEPMRLDATPLCETTVAKMCGILTKVPTPALLTGRVRPLYRWPAVERDAIIGRMPIFDRWGPLAEGSELREDNPYALDAAEGGDGGLDDSEPPSSAEGEGLVPGRRRLMVVSSSDDEGEHSDAGPLDSPPQRVEATSDGAGGAQDRLSEALEMVLSWEAPRRRALPRRKWVFIGKYETSPICHRLPYAWRAHPVVPCDCLGDPRKARQRKRGQQA